MISGKITAIALVPMSNCLKSKWISLISQHVETDPVLRALKIGSFPCLYMRGFLRQICFEENPSSMVLDTLQVEGDMEEIVKTIESFIRNTTDSAKSKVPETGDGWGVFPLRTSEILPVYLCPVKTKWKIGNTRYGDPYTQSSFTDFILVLMSPPRIKTEKDAKEWCKRVAAAIAGTVRIHAGVVMPFTFDRQKYKPLSIMEMEEFLKKQLSRSLLPASRKVVTEGAVKDYFEKEGYREVTLRTKESVSLDQQGIDLMFVKVSPQLTLALAQLESKLHFSKLKKFSKNAEKLFDRQRKKSSIKLYEKYHIAKDFDMGSRKFAKSNGINLLTFRDIAKKCPKWRKALKEQELLD